jgi:hypothetical protein
MPVRANIVGPSCSATSSSASIAATLLTALQPSDNLVIDAVDRRSKMFGSELGSTAADDGIAIGEGVGIRIGVCAENLIHATLESPKLAE